MRAYVGLFKGEDGWWVAEVHNMRGCITQGRTREEALERIQEAMRGWLAVMKDKHPEDLARLEVEEVEELEIAA